MNDEKENDVQELTHEQMQQVLTDPRSPIAQELARRVAESEKPGAKTYTSDEVLEMIDQEYRSGTRLSVNINNETAAILRKVMHDRGISATEATRRAIGWLNFVEDCQRAGHRLIVEMPGETMVHIPYEPPPVSNDE